MKEQRQQNIDHCHHAENDSCQSASPVQTQKIEGVIHERCQKAEQEHDMRVIRAVGV